jgi:hypothetical protein
MFGCEHLGSLQGIGKGKCEPVLARRSLQGNRLHSRWVPDTSPPLVHNAFEGGDGVHEFSTQRRRHSGGLPSSLESRRIRNSQLAGFPTYAADPSVDPSSPRQPGGVCVKIHHGVAAASGRCAFGHSHLRTLAPGRASGADGPARCQESDPVSPRDAPMN